MNNRQGFAKLINDKQYKVGAEIGVRFGYFSEFLLKNSKIEKLYSIDCWEKNLENDEPEKTFATAQRILSKFSGRSTINKAYSLDEAKQFIDNSLDFVYIDALHDYQSVLDDVNSWWIKIKIGGCLSGHDYDKDAWPGVFNAVNEFIKQNNLTLLLTGTGDNYGETDGNRASWYCFKKE